MFQSVKTLESSKEFKAYKKENPEAFLTHIFYMPDELNKNVFQIGYYDAKKDRITTFFV